MSSCVCVCVSVCVCLCVCVCVCVCVQDEGAPCSFCNSPLVICISLSSPLVICHMYKNDVGQGGSICS